MLPCIAPDAHLDLSRSLILAEATDVAQIPMIPGPQYLLLLLLPQKKNPKKQMSSGDSACLSMVFSVFDINISSNLGVCQSLAAASDRHTGSTTIWKLDLALYKLPLTQVQALQQTSRHQKQSMNVKKHGALPGKPETPEWRKGIPE